MHPPRHFACLDIGTNSVILLLASDPGDGTPVQEREWFRSTRLGEGMDTTGILGPEAVGRTMQAVEEFVREARSFALRPLHWAVVATSAARHAANWPSFRSACRETCGCPPRILSGREEAEIIYAGASSDLPADSLTATLDIGGGSTELAFGRGSRCEHCHSLELGCVRLAERFSLVDRPTRSSRVAAETHIRTELETALATPPLPDGFPEAPTCVASGGTATTLAALAQGLRHYDSARVHGYRTSPAEVARWTDEMLATPVAERRRIPVLEEGRARVLPAGLLILQECVQALGMQQIQVTTRGLRFGLARLMAEGRYQPAMVWPR
jgi:exopolyphosphatase/guanosine-5'-triphosphate,3'-diphosphate pyrophosphatase